MILTDEDPTAYYDCVATSPAEGCTDLEPAHARGSGAHFGISAYAREPVAAATTIFGSEVYPAARVLGTTYSFTMAVAAASGSRSDRTSCRPRRTGGSCRRWPAIPSRAGTPMGSEPTTACRRRSSASTASRWRTRPTSCSPPPPHGWTSRLAAHTVTLEIPARDVDAIDLGFVVFEARD